MKKLSHWLKTKFSRSNDDWTQMSSSIQKMAAKNNLHRRKNVRVLYPNSHYSAKLPQIIYNSKVEKAMDISLGGVCLLNDTNRFGLRLGEIISLSFRWFNEKDVDFKAVIVGHSYNKVHLQFKDLSTDIYVKLSINLKSGMVGRKIKRSLLNENEAIQSEYSELWVGLNNEKLIFFNADSLYAKLSYFGTTIDFFEDKKPQVFNKQGSSFNFTEIHLSDCLILLTNIPSPSDSIKKLICLLQNFNEHYRNVG